MTETLLPLHDRVLIERLPEEEVSSGGIIIAEQHRQPPPKGRVMAAGPGTKDAQGILQPLNVRVGDLVYFGKYSGVDVRLNEHDYLIMREEEILGVVRAITTGEQEK